MMGNERFVRDLELLSGFVKVILVSHLYLSCIDEAHADEVSLHHIRCKGL